MIAAIAFVLVFALAAVNGGNDVSKGVATLAGAGVTKFRSAILWGTITTFVGCLCSLTLADRMTKLFSSGIVNAPPSNAFALAVLAGAAAWVGLATRLRLPVSTTHAIIGALLGAGVLLDPGAVAWGSIPTRVVRPLLLSVGVAYIVSAGLTVLMVRRRSTALVSSGSALAISPLASGPVEDEGSDVAVSCCCPDRCGDPNCEPVSGKGVLTIAHWITSGLTGFARGLNDTPKIVAIGAFALVPAGMPTLTILLTVSVAMALGSIVSGMRVAHRLGCDVVQMSHREGFTANLATAALVGLGAGYGLPMSTTHVSTGAIAGSAGTSLDRLRGKTLRDFAIAWLVTPLFAAAVAALIFLVVSR